MVSSRGVGAGRVFDVAWVGWGRAGQMHSTPASCHHIIVPPASWWRRWLTWSSRKGPWAPSCLLEGTHVPALFLGWGDSQPSKGTRSIFSHKSLVLFRPPRSSLCGSGILCHLGQDDSRVIWKPNQRNLLWVLSICFVFVSLLKAARPRMPVLRGH